MENRLDAVETALKEAEAIKSDIKQQRELTEETQARAKMLDADTEEIVKGTNEMIGRCDLMLDAIHQAIERLEAIKTDIERGDVDKETDEIEKYEKAFKLIRDASEPSEMDYGP